MTLGNSHLGELHLSQGNETKLKSNPYVKSVKCVKSVKSVQSHSAAPQGFYFLQNMKHPRFARNSPGSFAKIYLAFFSR